MRWIFAVMMVAALPGAAQERDITYVSGDGHRFLYETNENGAILTSQYPTARFIEAGVNSRVVEGIEIVYLGRDCDAFNETFGTGTWGWANGGFIVEFERFGLGFPRQEIFVPNWMDCRL